MKRNHVSTLSREELSEILDIGTSRGPHPIAQDLRMDNNDYRVIARMQLANMYLQRIGFPEAQASDLVSGEVPQNEHLLTELQKAHCMTFPFENLSLFDHAKCSEEYPAVPRDDPSLNVAHTLHKIIIKKRGGFCWELNFAWLWLLRSLGFNCRLGNSYVDGLGSLLPGHNVVFVDFHDGDDKINTFMADVGFGEGTRLPVPIDGQSVVDPQLGDEFSIVPILKSQSRKRLLSNTLKKPIQVFPTPNTIASERFDSALMRKRKHGKKTHSGISMMGMPAAMEPLMAGMMRVMMGSRETCYYLNLKDDMEWDNPEFTVGLGSVVVDDEKKNMFTQKPMCLKQTEKGYDFIGKKYFKRMEFGKVTERMKIENDAHFRTVLSYMFGIELEAEMNPTRMENAVEAYKKAKAICAAQFTEAPVFEAVPSA